MVPRLLPGIAPVQLRAPSVIPVAGREAAQVARGSDQIASEPRYFAAALLDDQLWPQGVGLLMPPTANSQRESPVFGQRDRTVPDPHR